MSSCMSQDFRANLECVEEWGQKWEWEQDREQDRERKGGREKEEGEEGGESVKEKEREGKIERFGVCVYEIETEEER